MPARVEVRKHYRSDEDYRRDALAMEKRGWRVERASTREVATGCRHQEPRAGSPPTIVTTLGRSGSESRSTPVQAQHLKYSTQLDGSIYRRFGNDLAPLGLFVSLVGSIIILRSTPIGSSEAPEVKVRGEGAAGAWESRTVASLRP
jgi:hypothetical protein